VAALGERLLIERIRARIPPLGAPEVGPGDDAAVLGSIGPHALLAVDMLVEDVDFELTWASGADVGWKAMAVNASDIAAMSGTPRCAVASLCLPAAAELELVDGIVDGMLDAGRRWGAALVGGDLSGGPTLIVTVAVVGESAAPVLRSGAGPGDVLCVTGALGGAAGGLLSLRNRPHADDLPPAELRLRARLLRPSARIEAGLALAEVAVAMIDISDGLAVDLGNLLDGSEWGCTVDPAAVPVDPDLAILRDARGAPVDAFALALTGGEDFELLVALHAEDVDTAAAAVRAVGLDLTPIGTVHSGGRMIGDKDLDDIRRLGWEHLRAT
jgi:thiamine-monophosphate kinase